MEHLDKNLVDHYIKEVNSLQLPYKAELLTRNSDGVFDIEGLGIYDQMPNVKELLLLSSQEHKETQDAVKFLVVEIYDLPTNNGEYYGVPSISFVHDVMNDCAVSCYMINDDHVETFSSPIDAVLYSIKNFELDNYQRTMSVDLIEASLDEFETDEPVDREIAGLVIAQTLIQSLNYDDRNLFKTEIDLDVPKLIVHCPKYDNWADIIDTTELGNLQQQVISFTADNFSLYINESLDVAKFYCKDDLKISKKNKSKPY